MNHLKLFCIACDAWYRKKLLAASRVFLKEFGKIVCILSDFGKQEYCRTRYFCILKDGIRQSSTPTDTDIA